MYSGFYESHEIKCLSNLQVLQPHIHQVVLIHLPKLAINMKIKKNPFCNN